MKHCLIISGGAFSVPEESAVKNADCIIACDKGFDYAKKMGIMPDLIMGDFDSASEEPPQGARTIRFKKEKDDTDTMCAVKYALEQGFSTIVIACAFGGRFDHTFANIQTAAYAAENGARTTLLGDGEKAFVFKDSSITVEQKAGFSLSVFSLTEHSSGVYENGTKYTLDDAHMHCTCPLGVSNEWIENKAEIGVKNGILLVVESKLDAALP